MYTYDYRSDIHPLRMLEEDEGTDHCLNCGSHTLYVEKGTGAPFCNDHCWATFWTERNEPLIVTFEDDPEGDGYMAHRHALRMRPSRKESAPWFKRPPMTQFRRSSGKRHGMG